ncbi:MAG: tyrosine-type recombinase/integrase [Microcella sp.]|uniref:tyrosine-type recombinase/integrase n=1 Tax=Microcella sp. TaxID=1913979 RepID=UPI002718C440|nr:site-specific integrase [Microcella sp.]MDO8338442.1 tyrosine-type recombinase/integrase [Microcella sp.]
MPSVEPYQTASGRRWRARYRDPERRQREKGGFTRKIDAEDYLAAVTVGIRRGEYIDPAEARVTVAELGREWLANQTHLKPSSLRPIESSWRVHVEPEWGRRRVSDIRHSEVQGWVTRLSAEKGATVVRRAHGVLTSVLEAAVRDRRIATNPARGVSLPRRAPKRREYLSMGQVELLAREAGAQGALVMLLAYTGLRWGEATALRVRDVDMLRRRVHVVENAVRIGAVVHVGTPKSHRARSVPFPSFLVDAIAAECIGKSRDRLVFGDGVTHVRATYGERGWFAAAVRASQAGDADFPRLTLHDLRHTAASLAISAGANVKAVQAMLGHASATMTLDVYADLFDDDLEAVAVALDRLRAANVAREAREIV